MNKPPRIKKVLKGIILIVISFMGFFLPSIVKQKKEEIIIPEDKTNQIQPEPQPDKPEKQSWQIIREPMRVVGDASASIVSSIKDIFWK